MRFALFSVTVLAAAAEDRLHPAQESGETVRERDPDAGLRGPPSLPPDASAAPGASGRRLVGPCGRSKCKPDDVWDPYWGRARMNSVSANIEDAYDGFAPPDYSGKVDASGVKIYVIDTGIDFEPGSVNEYEFEGVIDRDSDCNWSCPLCGSPFVDEHGVLDEDNYYLPNRAHGTHVASTACGNVHGLAKNCELCSVKIRKEGKSQSGNRDIIAGFRHVIENCDIDAGERCVINASVRVWRAYYPQDAATLDQVAAEAIAAGIVIVAGAGNDTKESEDSPATVPGVITVGAIKYGDEPWENTNYGDAVAVYAPGKLIFAAHPDQTTPWKSGTSMATPFVTALAAGLLHNCVAPSVVRLFITYFSSNKGVDTRSPEASTRWQGEAAGIATTIPALSYNLC